MTPKSHLSKEAPKVPKWSSTSVAASRQQPLQLMDAEEHKPPRHRPRTAPGSGAGRSQWQSEFRTKVSRPYSAPALLRERTHKDIFLSRIEDNAVQTNVEQLRREQYVQKEIVSSVDVMTDISLSDLLLMHNKSQRANSSRGPRRARRKVRSHQDSAVPVGGITPTRTAKVSGELSKQSKSSPETKVVRDLCATLDQSIEYHSFSFGWLDGQRRRPSDSKLSKSAARVKRGISRSSLSAVDAEAEDMQVQLTDEEARPKVSASEEGRLLEARMKERTNSAEEVETRKTARRLSAFSSAAEAERVGRATTERFLWKIDKALQLTASSRQAKADKKGQDMENVQDEADKESRESPSSSKGKAEILDRPLIDPLRCPSATGEFLTALAQLLVSTSQHGTLFSALRSMDSKGRGRLSRKEWQQGLEKAGFPAENVPQSWKLLARGEGQVFLENMEALLGPYLLNSKR